MESTKYSKRFGQGIFMALIGLFLSSNAFAQNMSINNDGAAPDSSAMLDISDTSRGLLVPRLTQAQITSIASPATGLILYNTTDSVFQYFNGNLWLNAGSSGQDLSFISPFISISGGSAVDITDILYEKHRLPDTLGIHLMSANMVTDGSWINGDEDDEGLFVNFSGEVGIGTNAPTQLLDVSGIAEVDSLRVNNAYGLPTTDGTAGQVLETDGSGNVTWENAGGSSVDTTRIADADNNTKIQVEESANEDIIRFDIAGTEVMRLHPNGRMQVSNAVDGLFIGSAAGSAIIAGGQNTFIGYEAGTATTNNSNNTFVGYRAGYLSNAAGNTVVGSTAGDALTSGARNTMLGQQAGSATNTGAENVFIGQNAGRINASGQNNVYVGTGAGDINTGSNNIFIGHDAGAAVASGSDQLYISNTNDATPLIYGDFANDSVKVHGVLQVDAAGSGDAQIVLEADEDNNDENDNPSILLTQDGGTNEGFIGLEGTVGNIASSTTENAMVIGTPVNEDVQIFSNGIVRMTIEGNGSVGIGTTEPDYDFHLVDSTGNASMRLESETPTGDAYMQFDTDLSQYTLENFGTNGKFVMRNDNSGVEAIVIDTFGRVGVNMSTPSAEFEVQGRAIADTLEVDGEFTLPAQDGTNGQVMQTDGSGNVTWEDAPGSAIDTSRIADIDNDTRVSVETNDSIRFEANGTQWMNIAPNGDIGMGTSSMVGASKLTIAENVNAYTGMYIRAGATGRPFYGYSLNGAGSGWTYVDGTDANKWKLNLNGSDRLTVTTAGDIGVGTTTPNAKLDIATGGALTSGLRLTGTVSATVGPTIYFDGNARDYAIYATNASATAGANKLVFRDVSGGTDRMVINSAGDVGIGTTNPLTDLHMSGTGEKELRIQSTSASSAILRLTNTTNNWDIRNFAGEFRISLNNSSQFTIETTGEVGIGTFNPTSELEVVGDIEVSGDYTYSAAKTRYASVSAAGFTPLQGVSGSETIQNIEIGGFSTGNSRWIAGGTNNDIAWMFAPIQLPDGAVVSRVDFYVYDNDNTAEVIGDLYRQTLGSTITTQMATTATTGVFATPGTTTTFDSTIGFATVDNSSYSYYLRVQLEESNLNLRIFGARVTYTVTEAD